MPRTPEEKARYLEYINHSPLWQEKRYAVVVVRAGDICEFMVEDGTNADGTPRRYRCTSRADHCHHLTYAHLYNEPLEDLQALCNLHHKAVHIWRKRHQCRCGRAVFDNIEDAVEFVAEDERLDWEDLYDQMPTMCARCIQAAIDARLHHSEPCAGQGRQGGRSHEHVNHSGRSNGHCTSGPGVRTTMSNSSIKPLTGGNRDDEGDAGGAVERDNHVKIKPINAGIEVIWHRWLDQEQMIASHGVTFDYVEHVPLTDVDWKKSQTNPGRFGPRIIEETVEGIVLHARQFRRVYLPALIAWRPGGPGTKLLCGDGLNRSAALHELEQKFAAMYILNNPGPKQAAAVIRGANSLVGKGDNQEEKIQKAIAHYWENQPYCTFEQAAASAKIKPGPLILRVRSAELKQRFSPDGETPVPGYEELTDTALLNLSNIANSTVCQQAAIGLLTIPHHSHTHAERLKQAIKKTRPSNEQAMLITVATEIAIYAKEQASVAGRKHGGPASRQQKLLKATRQLNRVYKETLVKGVDIRDILTDAASRIEFAELRKENNIFEQRFMKGSF
jgi:hypothetical protein